MSESHTEIAILCRVFENLRRLSAELGLHNVALSRMDLCAVERQLAVEQRICDELLSFRNALKDVQLSDLPEGAMRARSEIVTAMVTHEAFIRKSRYSIGALTNILAGEERTYLQKPDCGTFGVFLG